MTRSERHIRTAAYRQPSLATWLMLLLLALSGFQISGSANRLRASQNEESCQQTVTEELKEETRLEITRRELSDRSVPAEQRLAVQNRWGSLTIFAITRPAELLGRNGCGSALRC